VGNCPISASRASSPPAEVPITTILRPGINVLYMSGYTDKAIVHQQVLDENTPFIQKPFAPQTFVNKVREVLDKALSRLLKSGDLAEHGMSSNRDHHEDVIVIIRTSKSETAA
jgi:DNA-binding NtrC family response regulator